MFDHVNENCDCQGKVCSKCAQLKCAGNYNKDKRLRSGLKSKCKICDHAAHKQWRENNKEYNYLRKKIWNEVNAERVREVARQYRKRTTEHRNTYLRQYRKDNYERVRAREKAREARYLQRRRENRRKPERQEKEKAAWQEYYQQRKKSMSLRAMRYFAERPGYRATVERRRRDRKRQAGGSHTYQEWLNLKKKYNYTCLCCGKREPEIQLHADHVVPVYMDGSSDIGNIQPLCRSCNSSKGKKFMDFRPQST